MTCIPTYFVLGLADLLHPLADVLLFLNKVFPQPKDHGLPLCLSESALSSFILLIIFNFL